VVATALNITSTGETEINASSLITTTTFTGAGTLELNESLNGNINFDSGGGDGLVTLLGGKNITGAVDNKTGSDRAGTLRFLGGTQSISGDIGATNSLELVDVASGTTTFSGDVNAFALNLSDDGTAVIASGKSITGKVTNSTSGTGTLTLSGGNQTVSGYVGYSLPLKEINIEAASGETATFSGYIWARTINVNDDGTVALAKGVNGGSSNLIFNADGVVELADSGALYCNVSNTASGEGTLTLSGAYQIYGNIGNTLLGNDGLKLVTVGNGDGYVGGDIKAATVNFAGDNTMTVGAGYGITGAVTTTTNNTGTLTFGGATSTGGTIGASGKALKELNFNGTTLLSNNIFATDTYVKSGSTTTLTGDVTATGNLTLESAANAVLDLDLNTLTVDGIYTQNAGSTLKIKLSDADYGNISSSGVASTSATSILDIDVTDLLTGDAFKIIDGAAGSGLNVPVIAWDSPLFTITGSASGNDLWINVVRGISYEAAALNSNASATGRALDNAPTTGDMATVKGQLDSFGSREEITDALDTMSPIADGGEKTVTNNLIDKFVGATILRLQDSKVEKVEEAEAEENQEYPQEQVIPRNDIWVQFYGDHADQDARGLSNGYRATIWGTVIGIDRMFMDGALRLGLAQGFGFGKIKSRDGYGRTSIDSYQTGVYGEFQGNDNPYVIDVALTYGYNEYDSSRHIDVGTIARTAQSDYDGQQFSSYIEAGYKLNKRGFDIIPLLALNYTHLYVSSYTETGADSLNLSVESQNYDSLQPGVGCRISRAFETKNSIITPELRLHYFYDVIGDKEQTIASFAGGGTSFETLGYRPASSSFDLGLRLEFFNKKNVTVLADCSTVFKSDYYEVGGSLTFKYSF
ncbi:MAG: autotransporter outer membrane beta-barrel domain-containing protein, partial [Candidatus Omnitrophica bacterium]|nr:autotransporter outer membrane beta-barrel domain-containing protein [Candidatus Omnitrophota bacterium]